MSACQGLKKKKLNKAEASDIHELEDTKKSYSSILSTRTDHYQLIMVQPTTKF